MISVMVFTRERVLGSWTLRIVAGEWDSFSIGVDVHVVTIEISLSAEHFRFIEAGSGIRARGVASFEVARAIQKY